MSVWKEDFIKVNPYTRPGNKLTAVRKIIVHYTANPGANASNHQRYFGGTAIQQKRYASAHIFVDKNEAICIVPLSEVAYAANDIQQYVNGKPYRGVPELLPNANFLSVSVELCIEKDGDFHPDTVKRAVDVVAELCKKFNLDPIDDIVRHYDVTHKNCPAPWVKNKSEFEQFKKDVKAKLCNNTSPSTSKSSTNKDNEYVVKKGDTLWSISRDLKIDLDTLKKLNPKINASNLQIGQKIKVKEDKPSNSKPKPSKPSNSGWIKNTVIADSLNVRTGRGTENSIVLTLPKGSIVKYQLGSTKNGWGYISYTNSKGKTFKGYVNVKYIKSDSELGKK